MAAADMEVFVSCGLCLIFFLHKQYYLILKNVTYDEKKEKEVNPSFTCIPEEKGRNKYFTLKERCEVVSVIK